VNESAGQRDGDERLFGVVLCGGQSRRMGRDKARLLLDGHSLLERAVGVLREVTPRVVLACGPTDRYAELGLERVLDRTPDLGPLGGLEAALARMLHGDGVGPADRWLLALACDMPRATGAVFRALLARARERRADACLVAGADGLEPLYAVYRGTCFAPVRRALDAGERRMISFHRGFGELAIEPFSESELAAGERDCVHNLNTPSEYRAEAEALA